MSARNAFISSSRPTLFKEMDIEVSDNTAKEIKSTLQTINELIQFINCFRYRNTPPLESDIEMREQLTKWLSNKPQQEALKNKVFAYWHEKQIPIEQTREKEKTISNIFADFMSYAEFAHLTATELAVITIAIQKLILFLRFSQQQIKDVIIQEAVRNKLNELVQSQEAIIFCMRKHQDVFKKNKIAADKQQSLPTNDILLAILQSIEELTGTNVADNWPLEPDKSLLFAIPDLPFGEVDEAKTAMHYFEACCAAYLESKKWTAAAGAALNTASEWTGWCFKGAWWLTSTVVTAPIKAVDGGVKMTTNAVKDLLKDPRLEDQRTFKKEDVVIGAEKDTWVLLDEQEPDTQLDAMTLDLHSYVEKMAKLVSKELAALEQSEEVNIWKNKIKDMIAQLKLEKEKCASSCLSFFMGNEIKVKKIKINALADLLLAEDLPDLQEKAKIQMECEKRKMILAGRASRTKKMLEEIVSIPERSVASCTI